MADEFHPAVVLMLARMESNPEEFVGGHRWNLQLNTLREHANKEEKAAINEVYKKLQLDAAHSNIMKELLNAGNQNEVRQGRGIPLPSINVSQYPYNGAGQVILNSTSGVGGTANTLSSLSSQDLVELHRQRVQLEYAKQDLERRKQEFAEKVHDDLNP